MLLTMENNFMENSSHSQDACLQLPDKNNRTRDETSPKQTCDGTIARDEPIVRIEDNGMRPLGPSFTRPGQYDVICARGSKARNHVGNRRFRQVIKSNLDQYCNAATKMEKSSIVSGVIDAIRRDSPEGGFVKEVDGKYFEVGDHAAREKVGQCFRDLLFTKYKSSTKAKMAKRKESMSSPECSTPSTSSSRSCIYTQSPARNPYKTKRLHAITSKIYPIDPISDSFPPHSVPSFVGSYLQHSLAELPEPKYNSQCTAIGTLQTLGLMDDVHIDWEYGPISFSKFEQSLRAAEEDFVDEQITASIFDLPDNDMSASASEIPEPDGFDLNHFLHQSWGKRDNHNYGGSLVYVANLDQNQAICCGNTPSLTQDFASVAASNMETMIDDQPDSAAVSSSSDTYVRYDTGI